MEGWKTPEVVVHPVELFGSRWRIRGKLATTYHGRLSDYLNQQILEFITLQNASLSFFGDPTGTQQIRGEAITVARREILFVHPVDEPGVAPPPASSPPFAVHKIPHRVLCYLDTHLIEGNLHLVREMKIRDALDSLRDLFLALTDATVSELGASGLMHTSYPFISVNKEHIVALLPVSSPEAGSSQSAQAL